MSKITLTGGYAPIPEGQHLFRITEVEYKETYGKLEIRMKTPKGQIHTERFSLHDQNGKPNEGAYNAFSYFARTALDDYGREEIDPQELVGCCLLCTVVHDIRPSTRDESKTVTFTRLAEKLPVSREEAAAAFAMTAPAGTTPAPKATGTPKASGFNLDDLLA